MVFLTINMSMKKAPSFCLLDQDTKKHCLKDYAGSWLLLYFYPKDDTPGCTQEACAIRDSWAEFKKKKIVVLGVSADADISHQKFQKKYKLPFPLLVDTEKKVIRLFGVEGEKSMFGKKYLGIKRESFLINPEGKIVKHYEKVKPLIHAEQVLKDFDELI